MQPCRRLSATTSSLTGNTVVAGIPVRYPNPSTINQPVAHSWSSLAANHCPSSLSQLRAVSGDAGARSRSHRRRGPGVQGFYSNCAERHSSIAHPCSSLAANPTAEPSVLVPHASNAEADAGCVTLLPTAGCGGGGANTTRDTGLRL